MPASLEYKVRYQHPGREGAKDQKPWVAEITGLDEQFGLAREFVKGEFEKVDNVLWVEWALQEGHIYNIYDGRDKTYCLIANGKPEAMDWHTVKAMFENDEAGGI